MSASLQTSTSTVKRGAKRALYDQTTVHKIIDETMLCHIGQQVNGQVFVTPTCHWREGDYLYWHGHGKARNAHGAAKSEEKVCINICALDGLVLARSAFNHSVNYRSVTLFGIAEEITDFDEKARHFKLFVDKFCPNRWDQLRPMTATEVNATALVRIKIDEASAKVRQGAPVDDEADKDWPVWSGVLPLTRQWGTPETDASDAEQYNPPQAPECF
ncbi:pyridoxamine 5'-phosphate oxidase family protein [Maribrevibacterium harenarium]|uniref:Pyridoxamine 5'-phosphate oxidase family protein n=1 Tax=Maribrevibacterium harenarium TaxID=2589817 RepID=A0A501X4E2_9GAMM|nr:pyridoxamine 5'-phosphate oxidase family protein [Maribrevibacterium harenarium]TPE55309.1 pyridoxamine 5'-phosphate oxidase family protein [Maribrevibacterium harenarium]